MSEYLGDFSEAREYAISLTCTHCNVDWLGCMAASECPKCGWGKGYHFDDRNKCYCPECSPEFFAGKDTNHE